MKTIIIFVIMISSGEQPVVRFVSQYESMEECIHHTKSVTIPKDMRDKVGCMQIVKQDRDGKTI